MFTLSKINMSAYLSATRFGFILTSFLLALSLAHADNASYNNMKYGYPHQETRVALVIGNAGYSDAPLNNPINDAKAISAKLRKLGFDVIEKHNLNKNKIGRTLNEFRSKISPGGVALFYYSGHGMQVNGVNYLPAVDADISSEDDVPTQAIDLNKLLMLMESTKSLVNLVFLDACRNNPFGERFRTGSNGLSPVVVAPKGTLIFYATRPGSLASDGKGQHSTYTKHMLNVIDTPGISVEQVQKRVAAAVRKESIGRQEPWMEGLLDGDFYFEQKGSQTYNNDERKRPADANQNADSNVSTKPRVNSLNDAAAFLRQGQPELALASVSEYLVNNENDANGNFIKGLILTELKRTHEAIDVFLDLIRRFPSLPEPYNNVAVLYASLGEYQQSKQYLEKAIATNPTYATAYENLGDIHAKLASMLYDRSLQINNDNATALSKIRAIKNIFDHAKP